MVLFHILLFLYNQNYSVMYFIKAKTKYDKIISRQYYTYSHTLFYYMRIKAFNKILIAFR